LFCDIFFCSVLLYILCFEALLIRVLFLYFFKKKWLIKMSTNMYVFGRFLSFGSKFGLRFFGRKRFVSVVCLLLLFSFPFLSVFSGFSFAVDPPKVFVANEADLRDAVSAAAELSIIVLEADIQLTVLSLEIPVGSHIILTNADDTGPWKLVGVNGQSTITVNGVLVLDGINVTHVGSGRGVTVNADGKFVMNSCWIFGNSLPAAGGGYGGGVYNLGTFEMLGGVIANNTAYYGGGGVFNSGGNFFVSGDDCLIVNNTASSGGGVCNLGGDFVVSGVNCMIFNNTATDGYGGGVFNDYFRVGDFVGGTFKLYSGVIANNSASSGGGVHSNVQCLFEMYGGVIANNTALYGGVFVRGVYGVCGAFTMFGGAVADNLAYHGGGIYNNYGNFTLSGGVITDNLATGYGGGVYSNRGNFVMSDGKIADNVAVYGGGVYTIGNAVYVGNFTLSGGVISNNEAILYGGGVFNNAGNFVLSDDGEISGNLAESGGGVFTVGDAAVFTMSGGVVADNVADVIGGGVYLYSGRVDVLGGFIANNVAADGGGGIWVTDVPVDVAELERLTVSNG
jgi:hypothetical protein